MPLAYVLPFSVPITFQEIINEWDEQERIAQEKAEQESSLYRYRSRSGRTALSEEEEEELELRKLFPLHEKVAR
jgi:midasin